MADRTITGLSAAEVEVRRQRGEVNTVEFQTGRTYLQIVRKNAFTFINTVLFGIGVVLVLMGQIGDAVVTAGLVLLNVIVGVYQEGRAKHKLDRIALLTRPTATVIRDGEERSVDPADIVLDDVLVVRAGDQIVVDGDVVGDGRIEVDESLLTGESERASKRAGDTVYSGTFCVAGSARYEARKVGTESVVNQMTEGVRAFRQVKTPLQCDIEFIIRILVIVVTLLGILLSLSLLVAGAPMVEWLRVAAVVVALVPQGLFFMSTVAYSMGAVRVAGRGALIQEANAVESTSHVNLLCLDKTGTLTTNSIELEELVALDGAGPGGLRELQTTLGCYAASATGGNRTTAAMLAAFGGHAAPVKQEVLFSSERKWSAVAFDAADLPGVYVLGAPEILRAGLDPDARLEAQVDERASRGRRVLLFAHHSAGIVYDGDGAPVLPTGLAPLGLLSFQEELRPSARETLRHFSDLGIEIKLISGDHPRTVDALARQVGLSGEGRAISGVELGELDGAPTEAMAREATVFGRVTPQQKEKLVDLFRASGCYVAMVGDGVNDVLSLKKAHVGIAMHSASQATRGIADIVLLQDSFAALPVAFREGQRIVRGMEDVVRLLLTRTFYVLLLVIASQLIGLPFPVTPKHNSILALLTVGIPILAIAAWARPGPPPKSVVRSTSHFVFPAALTVALVALSVYLAFLVTTADVEIARTALTTCTVLCGLLLIPFVEPPSEAWVGGDSLSGDWRPTLLACAMLMLYLVIMAVPPLRGFFELVPLRVWDWLAIAGATVAWAVVVRVVWRSNALERLVALQTG